MPAPHKHGLKYFPHDVDMSIDQRIEYIEAETGLIGYAIYNKLLEKIYRVGYFLKWDDRDSKLFSKHNNIEVNVCINSINVCINEGLFCKNIYEKYNILTSKSIQKRYLEANTRRNQIRFIKEFALFPIDELKKIYKKLVIVDINSVNVDINSVNVDINSKNVVQTKLNKTKLNKTKLNKTILSGNDIPYEKIIDYLNEITNSAFRYTSKKTRSLIHARWQEGYREEDFYYVIDIKTVDWLDDLENAKYLRPETLFGTKFEGYRNQKKKLTQEERDEKIKQECIEEYYRKHPEKKGEQ